jgi:uncharacterized membrane protein YhaH (DUF805 family)
VFEVPAESLLVSEPLPTQSALTSMHKGVLQGLEFTGTTARGDFWWFALGVIMFLAVAQLLADVVGQLPMQIASLLALLPWIAACTRRLRDAGLSPWWQLISLAPVAGILVLLYLLTYPTKVKEAAT